MLLYPAVPFLALYKWKLTAIRGGLITIIQWLRKRKVTKENPSEANICLFVCFFYRIPWSKQKWIVTLWLYLSSDLNSACHSSKILVIFITLERRQLNYHCKWCRFQCIQCDNDKRTIQWCLGSQHLRGKRKDLFYIRQYLRNHRC